MKRLIHIIIAALSLLASCTKEAELITGRITGRMTIYDQTYNTLSDRSGIEVTLLGLDSIAGTGITDSNGGYTFNNVPYGKYRMNLRKDGYIQQWNPPFIYHIGGGSPTYSNLSIFEIPFYELSLDSIGFNSDSGDLIIYLKFNGDTVIIRNSYGYRFIAYAGDSPDVSKDKYITMGKGLLRDYYGYHLTPKVAVFGRISNYEFYPRISDAITGTVYLRIYPLANGQGYGTTQFYKEALGKPSNVIGFMWNEIAGK